MLNLRHPHVCPSNLDTTAPFLDRRVILRALSCSVKQPHGWQPARLLWSPWDSPGQNTGAGCHFYLQGIFWTQGPNLCFLCLLHWQADPSPLSHQGSPVCLSVIFIWASLVAQLVKELPAIWETWVRSLGWEDPLEKRKTTRSSILAWRIQRLQSPQATGSQRVRHT